MVDEATKKTLASIPLLRTNAGPREGDQWAARLKEEYLSLIKVICSNLVFNLYQYYKVLSKGRSKLFPGSHHLLLIAFSLIVCQ